KKPKRSELRPDELAAKLLQNHFPRVIYCCTITAAKVIWRSLILVGRSSRIAPLDSPLVVLETLCHTITTNNSKSTFSRILSDLAAISMRVELLLRKARRAIRDDDH